MTYPISRYPVPNTDELPQDIRAKMLEVHGAITALFALSNRMAHLTNMRANQEFYLMGRVPPAKK